jgi:diguanylate cyclase (GGDEF)-like protein
MRISTITNWAYVITVGLTLLSGGAFINATRFADRERDAVQEARDLDDRVDGLELSAGQTTEDARLYVVKGEDRYLKAFQGADAQERARERALRALNETSLIPQEVAALRVIEQDAEVLDAIEERAVKDFGSGASDKARSALFSAEHEEAQNGLMSSVDHFKDLVATRTSDGLRQAKAEAEFWGTIAKSLLVLTALVFLSVLYFVLRQRVARPLIQMSSIVRRLAKQDYDVPVMANDRRDEIGDMNEAIRIFRDNGLERDRLDAERKKDQQTKDSILQLMHRLQACRQEDELAPVVSLFAVQIFPELDGHLFVMNDGRTVLTSAATWGAPIVSKPVFPAHDCWGLRRGRAHLSGNTCGDVLCQHLDGHDTVASLCVPLVARGDTVGMLYFEGPSDGAWIADARVYIELIAENLALAIANQQLRDRLTNLAVKDPLTGLLNRRSLDENLKRLRQDATDLPSALLMIDIDHFKRFNDEFGHDAGDFVMGQVAAIMTDVAGNVGLVHRFGGEEFAVIMRSADRASAFKLAEGIRIAIESTPVNYLGRPLGKVTVSMGLALTENDRPASTLMQRADAALLRAKAGGRNITVADWTHMGEADRRIAG